MSDSTISFEPRASIPQKGMVLIYDLESFSTFFNQPDMQDYVPKYINHISSCLSKAIFGGKAYWEKDPEWVYDSLLKPIHEKYLGDGCLYVWSYKGIKDEKLIEDHQVFLCNRLWNLKNNFKKVTLAAMEDVPVAELPKRIRFGIASGTIYELTTKNSNTHEYIGFCINLASRLQKYCPELGFIASARMAVSSEVLEESGYVKVIATKLKGFPKELVFVDKKEFERLDKTMRSDLFQTTNQS